MKTSVERLEGNVVKLTVALNAAEVDESIDKTYKEYSARIKVPGFRPGKAPKPVVDSYVGQDVIYGEATESLVQESYPDAVDAEGLRPIEQPKVEDLTPVTPGEAFEWSAEVQVRPELTLSAYDDLSITVPSAEVTDTDIDLQVEELRGRYANLGPVTDRGAAENDFVLMSFVGYVDGEEYEGNRVDKYLYQMSMGTMPVEFDEQLAGAMAGEDVHIEFVIPPSSSVAEFVGKTASFDVAVHEIKSQNLPEVNDEFAMQVGGFDTLEELRDVLRQRLVREKEIAQIQAKEVGVRRALAERLEGDIPEVMIGTRAESMMRDFITGLENRGINLEQYLEMSGSSDEVVAQDMQRRAELSVREDLALEALFRQLDMEITDDDIEEELDLVASATKTDKAEARAQWEEMGLMPALREQVQHRKAVNWLLENVNIEVAEPRGTVVAENGEAEGESRPKAQKKSRSKTSKQKKTAEAAESNVRVAESFTTETPADETADTAAEPTESEE